MIVVCAFVSLFVVLAEAGRGLRADSPRPEGTLRTAVLTHDDEGSLLRSVELALDRLRADAGIGARVEVARGTYADLFYWLETGAIDMAVVSPALLAKALERGGSPRWEYLASVISPALPAPSVSVAVVREDSPIHTIEDLRALAARGAGRLLFVNPLSVSGALAPRVALASAKISIPDSGIRYTHSHSNSLRALRLKQNAEAVAFVWNGMLEAQATAGIRKLELPALAKLRIPPDSLIVRADYPALEKLRKAVANSGREGADVRFEADPAWRDADARVRSWLTATGAIAPERLARLDLDELGELLVHYARAQAVPLRLAVVFSGGGAKCSYQVGAIRAVEEKLSELRQQTGDPSLDISLVVGTSGGAINALPVAMGMSSSPALYQEMTVAWRSLDQREIIRPAFVVRLNMALWFASIQFLFFSWIFRQRFNHVGKSRYGRWLLCLIAGVVEVAAARLPVNPWNLLGARPEAHRFYLWLTFGIEGCGWILAATGALGLALRATGAEGRPLLLVFRRMLRIAAIAAIIVLPVLQAWTMLSYEPTLSEGFGIEDALFDRFSQLVAAKRRAEGRVTAPLPFPSKEHARAESLQAMSRQIIGDAMISRDLVLTGSVLGEPGLDLPSDLYFWVSAGKTSEPPRFGARGISLAERPHLLLDALLASGAIYPVFPARLLHDFPRTGQKTEIVDGSFAHRSPVEAAVLWGATHIILIQADPDELVPRGSFGANIAAALVHLYEQAQLTDLRTRQQAMVFNLAPRPPHIGLLDFASNLIDSSIAKGYREVRGDLFGGALATAPFRKEVGLPHFVVLSDSGRDPRRSSP
jgi:predicted acylesterase/phospholipase RssA/ABC-type phosphate/phosphonate transport system substrate-binding protein